MTRVPETSFPSADPPLPAVPADGAPASAVPSAGVSAEHVRAALDRLLGSEEFQPSPRLCDFLRFVVEATLAGRAEEIKGYTIAVEALGRPPSFDPQSDPIVRVEATRLRRALERYYSAAGAQETLEILIPKGSYVPQFRALRRAAEETSADLPAPLALPPPPPAAGRVSRWRKWPVLLAGAAALIALWLSGPVKLDRGQNSLTLSLRGPATTAEDLADRMGLPVLEVRAFEIAGTPAPSAGDLHTLEVRMRDAFARFDFVDVMAPGADVAQRECRGTPARSVFSLTGLGEGHGDGTVSLLLRLSDACGGTILWSTALEGLKLGPDLPATEQKAVRDVASALLDSHAVIPTRARAQARAEASGSGFGCIARTFALLRGEDRAPGGDTQGAPPGVSPGAPLGASLPCLDDLVAHDNGYGIVHALKAMMLLEQARRTTTHDPDPGLLAQMLREAELGVDLAPSSAFAANVLAWVDFFQGEREAARAAAERAVALNPLDHEITATAGTLLIGLGQYAEGRALLDRARTDGAPRTPMQDVYLAISAFLRQDTDLAATTLSPLHLHPTAQSRIALALALHVLGRDEEERTVVATLARETPGGAAGVQRAVRALLPVQADAARVLAELTAAGLPAPGGPSHAFKG